MNTVYADRAAAGRALAPLVLALELVDPLVMGVPRGGMPLAYEIARELNSQLDVLLVHKLGHPWQPELAIGAVGEDGVHFIHSALVQEVSNEEIDREVERRLGEIEARAKAYRARHPSIDPAGREVVVVDDGAATGSTLLAGIELLRKRHAAKIVVAVPVASPNAATLLRGASDGFVCPNVEARFLAVGHFYRVFDPVTDQEVEELLVAGQRDGVQPQPGV